MDKQGVLETKLQDYYEDIDSYGYRYIFSQIVNLYKGKQFSSILDIGSGIGLMLDSIKPFGFDLHALEASEYGYEVLRKKDINVTKFFLEKNNPLPYEDNKFSAVIFNQVIEHVEKNVGKYYIGEIVRVLEPGGVGIIKSPSSYATIWATDPHHVYCWKPNELLKEVRKYKNLVKATPLERNYVEPWMLLKYNEKIIDKWHKYNKYPRLRTIFFIILKITDSLFLKPFGIDRLLCVSNINFVKKKI